MGEAEQAGLPEAWPKRPGERAGAAWTALTTAILVAIAVVAAMALKSALLFASIGSIVYEYIERPASRRHRRPGVGLGHADPIRGRGPTK